MQVPLCSSGFCPQKDTKRAHFLVFRGGVSHFRFREKSPTEIKNAKGN